MRRASSPYTSIPRRIPMSCLRMRSSRSSRQLPAGANSMSGSDGYAATAIPGSPVAIGSTSAGGFSNSMRIYPELKLGLVAMGNATTWDHLKLVQAAIQAVG